MDLNNISFGPMLLGIIETISTSHFVSFDLEMSGIPSKPPANRQKQTLQERYVEVKEAAEKYAVLQIGITCIEEYDAIYVLRPYNFYLSPIITEDLEIERIWSYQDGAVKFLLGHGFDMSAPFTRGVEYLSRNEEKLAKQR
jgi:poly(A)-specific ribonuclease